MCVCVCCVCVWCVCVVSGQVHILVRTRPAGGLAGGVSNSVRVLSIGRLARADACAVGRVASRDGTSARFTRLPIYSGPPGR